LNLSLTIVEKRRHLEDEKTEVMSVIGDVDNKVVLIVDDIISTGGTIMNATEALLADGAKEVWAACTHGVFSAEALEKIKRSQIKHLHITNSIPPFSSEAPLVHRIPIGKLFAESIKRVSKGESVSALFPHD